MVCGIIDALVALREESKCCTYAAQGVSATSAGLMQDTV